MLRRTFVQALIAAGSAPPAFARERVVARRMLAAGFDYQDLHTFGLPAVGSGEVTAEVAEAFARFEGASVIKALDEADAPCTRERLKVIVDEWAATVESGEIALIYYCGHGAVHDGRFHIITPDPALVPFQDIIDRAALRRPEAIIAFIDACRIQTTAPGGGGGPEPIERIGLDGVPERVRRNAPSGEAAGELRVNGRNIALIYSTELFETATAGEQSSWRSPFSAALLKYMGTRVDVMTLFGMIADEVRPQEPVSINKLSRPAFLVGRPPRFGRARDAWLNVPH